MSSRTLAMVVTFSLFACASGPHPALEVASKAFPCEPRGLTLHEIFPSKVRVEGCGKEGIYVKVCKGYGMESQCSWLAKAD